MMNSINTLPRAVERLFASVHIANTIVPKTITNYNFSSICALMSKDIVHASLDLRSHAL